MKRRLFGILAAAALVSACEQAEPPAPAAQPVAPVPRPVAPVPVAEAPEPAPDDEPRAPESAPEVVPVEPQEAQEPQAKPALRADASPAHVPPAPPELDLSLPPEWVEETAPAPSGPTDAKRLPPLFNRPIPPSSYQLGGRLIPDDRQEEIEGAEIRIEFYH